MEENEPKTPAGSESELDIKDNDRSAKIVSSVIHEYDIIDEPDNIESKSDDNDIVSSSPNTIDAKSSDQMNNRNRLSSSDRSSTVTDDCQSNLPRVNCPEKIILCIDASAEMDKLTFRSRAGDKFSPKQLIKRALGIFLQSKSRLDKRHEYAVILLKESATWGRDFTHYSKDVQAVLEDIVDSNHCESCDVGSVFDRIVEKVDIPQVEGDSTCFPPPYIIRLIFIYGRSNCPLEFHKHESFKLLNSSPYFFLDAIYLHEPPSEENRCQEVFNSICDLDQKGSAFILEASRNQTKFYDNMGQLLSHPLQRPLQHEAAYRVGSSVPVASEIG